MGIILLLVSVVFIVGGALAFRGSAQAGADARGTNAAYRIVGGSIAVVIGLLTVPLAEWRALPAAVWLVAAAAGVCYWLAGYANLRASATGHLGVTWTVIRCAMVLPAVASIVFWREVPLAWASAKMWLTFGGIGLTLTALLLFYLDRDHRSVGKGPPASRGWVWWLAAGFLFTGLWELCLRVSGDFAGGRQRLLFVIVVYAESLVLSVAMVTVQRFPMGRKEWQWGLLAGLCALIGSGVRPWVLERLPGVFVFPATAVGIMLLLHAASILFWRTRLGRYGWIATATAVLAVILLGIAK